MAHAILVVFGVLMAANAAGAEDASIGGQTPSLIPTTWNGSIYGCKCHFGNSCWPSNKEWAKLNDTVEGNLLVDTPPGASCHNTFEGPLGTVATYDAAKCAEVNASFGNEQWTTDQPAALLWTYFTNDTCRPTGDPGEPCTLGFYPVYVITAKTANHIKAGVDFTREKNIRLLIRNTGHDFIGRSTGWGSLVINTHSFQDVTFIDTYTGPGSYHGPAVTVGAGVQGRALLRQAHAHNPPQTLVTGECPTVGVAGGLVQGAGHGPLTTLHGFTADNALELSVLTASGEFKTANAKQNSDLFWALKGGGPSAYAVIVSATFRTYTDVPSTGAILNINNTHTNDTELFWAGVRAFHGNSNRFVDSGLYVYYELSNLSLHVQPFVAINQTAAQLDALLHPLRDELDALGLGYYMRTAEFPTFFDLYIDLFEDEVAGGSALTGGWMFAHEDMEGSKSDNVVAALRNVVDNGGFMIGHMWDAGHGWKDGVASSSTNPRFRNASDFVITGLPVGLNATWAEKQAAQELLTFNLDENFREAGRAGCGYVNENDPYQSNWQDHFYGTNYEKLYNIRKKWDPNGLFYSVATPGTEDWEVIDYGTKLCKKF